VDGLLTDIRPRKADTSGPPRAVNARPTRDDFLAMDVYQKPLIDVMAIGDATSTTHGQPPAVAGRLTALREKAMSSRVPLEPDDDNLRISGVKPAPGSAPAAAGAPVPAPTSASARPAPSEARKPGSFRQVLGSIRFWAGFGVACAMLLALDHAQEWMQLVMDAGTAYQRLLTGGGRAPFPRYTAIIEITNRDAPTEVLYINVCDQRLFVSRLLRVVGRAHPAAIVIDKFFSPGTCDAKPAGTQALVAAMHDLLRDGIPVVVGLDIGQDDYTVRPSLKFAAGPDGPGVREGAVTLHPDERRVPLIWPSVSDEEGNTRDIETLSLKAALARTSDLLTANPRLGRFYAENTAPYAGFLPQKSFERYTFSAMNVLCGPTANVHTDWRSCSSPDQSVSDRLRGRVVLLGENVPGLDQHATVVGTIPGVRLQANYIEALLDDDVFRPLPEWMTYAYSFLVFAIVEFLILSDLRWKLAAVLATVIAAYVLCYIVVIMTGIYLNPGIGIVAALVTQGAHALAHRLLNRSHQRLGTVAAAMAMGE
jgi:hypothetical protein